MAGDLTYCASHLAQRVEVSSVDTFEQSVDGGGAELVDRDGLFAEENVPRAGYGRCVVEQWCDHGAFGEAVEPGVGDDEHETARFVAPIGQPDVAGRRRQRRLSIQASTSASTRLPRCALCGCLGGSDQFGRGPELPGLVRVESGDDDVLERIAFAAQGTEAVASRRRDLHRRDLGHTSSIPPGKEAERALRRPDPPACENVPRMREHDVTEALKEWGAHHRDDPYALFAAVRQRGAVQPVTLVDGHDAWLVVRHDEALAALNDSRLSKDMHAAMAANAAVVSEGLPGPAFARHMLTVDPPDHTRLRRLVSSAFSPRRIEGLRPRIQAVVDDLLDGIAADGADSRVDLVSRFAFPLPFTVICELLGVPEPDRAALGRGLIGLLVPTSTPEQYAEAKRASDVVVALLEQLVEVKARRSG